MSRKVLISRLLRHCQLYAAFPVPKYQAWSFSRERLALVTVYSVTLPLSGGSVASLRNHPFFYAGMAVSGDMLLGQYRPKEPGEQENIANANS
ncbi:hypothetical protein shim_15560 [Shimia sp. SK013]|nr:hypothetical protein shim_15560 [Shimia sp. SK013]